MSVTCDKAELEASPPASGGWKPDKKRFVNDSIDSGIAGLKDHPFNSYSSTIQETEPPEVEYIVDPSSRTTYLKGKFLGKGGFARVHELMDLTTSTVYAGKIIPKNRLTKRHHMQKIEREILIHRNLIHKHVVRLHHFFEDAVNGYIILENCSRKSLERVLKQRHVVTEAEVRYYVRQLVAGVAYIHGQGVLHRDLKPANMFLSEDMVVKLGDFGLATQVDGDKHVICGTPNYIAPEVLNKLSYSFEADVWAIGCIMYAMLVGQPPFETATLKETYARILGNKYVPPPHTSEHARSLITDLLQPMPEDRPKLDEICEHEFFKNGYTPLTLPPSCCYFVPKFDVSTIDLQKSPQTQSQMIYQSLKLNNEVIPVIYGISPVKNTPAIDEFLPIEKAVHGCMPMPIRKEKEASSKQSSLKQKITKVLCPDKVALCRKRVCNAAALYHILKGCFTTMPSKPTKDNPPTVICSPLFVLKWIDYSDKYGFGFQLSDKSVGMLFNDGTRISFIPDRSRIEFHDINGKITEHPRHSVPGPLQKYYSLLLHFSKYMDECLAEGGEVKSCWCINRHKSTVPQMKRWVRTDVAIIMELCNGTLQLNFFEDHTKVVLSAGKHGYVVTYINSERQSSSYWLHQIAEFGCKSNIYKRLRYAAAVLQEFAELDGEEV